MARTGRSRRATGGCGGIDPVAGPPLPPPRTSSAIGSLTRLRTRLVGLDGGVRLAVHGRVHSLEGAQDHGVDERHPNYPDRRLDCGRSAVHPRFRSGLRGRIRRTSLCPNGASIRSSKAVSSTRLHHDSSSCVFQSGSGRDHSRGLGVPRSDGRAIGRFRWRRPLRDISAGRDRWGRLGAGMAGRPSR
jgi:hypothetical protein